MFRGKSPAEVERAKQDLLDQARRKFGSDPQLMAKIEQNLNEHVRAGRIKVFGGSNWSTGRVQQANDYAKSKGLQGFSAVSNNFSLARMIDAVWGGCIAAGDAESRAWFKQTQIPLLSWSSQARTFFVPGKAAPDKREDEELVRCWYSDDNFQRLARANELAAAMAKPLLLETEFGAMRKRLALPPALPGQEMMFNEE